MAGKGERDEERRWGGGGRRDGKRSACRVLFSGVGKAGERQARTAARDAEYERWGREGNESWSTSIYTGCLDTGSIDTFMSHYYVHDVMRRVVFRLNFLHFFSSFLSFSSRSRKEDESCKKLKRTDLRRYVPVNVHSLLLAIANGILSFEFFKRLIKPPDVTDTVD